MVVNNKLIFSYSQLVTKNSLLQEFKNQEKKILILKCPLYNNEMISPKITQYVFWHRF